MSNNWKEFVDHLIDISRIEDVIGSYISLKKDGVNYKALCPFHKEKTPSFVVSPLKRIYHCFGCNKGGNVYRFLMDYENVGFAQAVEILADIYSVSVPYKKGRKKDSFEEIYFALMAEIANFYHQNLLKQLGFVKRETAIKLYLKQRDIDESSIERFLLGYSPEDSSLLNETLLKKGFNQEDIFRGKVILQGSGGNLDFYDRFHGRLIFPIKNHFGKVAGFGARVLNSDLKAAKYINSAESIYFRKGDLLYGLYEAKDKIRETGSILIVEGYLDLIAFYQSGIGNVAAVLGTALTKNHAVKLGRFAKEVVLIFDSDDAGYKGIDRSGQILLSEIDDLKVSVVDISPAKDPDSYIKEYGKEKILKKITQKKGFVLHIIDKMVDKTSKDRPEAKIATATSLLRYISLSKNSIEKDELISYLAGSLSLNPDPIRFELEKRYRKSAKLSSGLKPSKVSLNPRDADVSSSTFADLGRERLILSILLNWETDFPSKLEDIKAEDFSQEIHKEIFEMIKKGEVDLSFLLADQRLGAEIASILQERYRETAKEEILDDALSRLRKEKEIGLKAIWQNRSSQADLKNLKEKSK